MDRHLPALIAALAAVAAWPATAGAHSIVRVNAGELTSLSADATSLNTLTATLKGSRVELRDPTVDGGMDPGPCDPGDIDGTGFVISVSCERTGLKLVRLDAGDREDKVTAELPIPVLALGGEGADTLRTGPEADTLTGDAGDDTLTAGAGNDRLDGGVGIDALDGGAGDDTLSARDGLADTVACGDGADRVDADTLDDVASDCETTERTATAPPPDQAGDRDRSAPRVDAGGPTVQRLGRSGALRLVATSTERGTVAASGWLDVAGLALPLLSKRHRIAVGGGGAEMRIRLSRSQLRQARRALTRGRKVTVRLTVVATDDAGNSSEIRVPRIRLRR